MFSISTAEPEDFEGNENHFEDCPAYSETDALCSCDVINAEIRADFALMARKCY